MPWKETCAVRERMRFVSEMEVGEVSFSELCQRYAISRETGYKWCARYAAEGPVLLGLEIPGSGQADLRRYLDSAGSEADRAALDALAMLNLHYDSDAARERAAGALRKGPGQPSSQDMRAAGAGGGLGADWARTGRSGWASQAVATATPRWARISMTMRPLALYVEGRISTMTKSPSYLPSPY